MTTLPPRHESKALRRKRERLEKRTKAYEATMRDKNASRAQRSAHKPGSGK